MKHPLVIPGLLYVAGVLLGWRFALPLPGIFAAAFGCGWAALFLHRFRVAALCGLLVFSGWVNMLSRTAILSPRDLRLVHGGEAAIVTVKGTLRATPEQRMFLREGKASWRTVAEVAVTELQRGEETVSACGTVAAAAPGVLPPEFFAGQRVEITGVLRPPGFPRIEGAFDYAAYLRQKGIHLLLQTDGARDWSLAAGSLPASRRPWADRFQDWARQTLAKGLPEEDEPLRLLWAMALGWKPALNDEVAEPFMRSGTLHVFAISGLHIALIAGILVKLLRLFQVPRGFCGVIVIPLIWAYAAATGWQASAIRSTVMMSIIVAGWSLERPSNLLNSLAAAGLVILAGDPSQLFQAGFQLSFFVVLGLALITPPLERLREQLLKRDPLALDSLRPRWRRILDGAVSLLTSGLATSLAAWLGSLPLIAWYFHMITPVSLLANLLVVPVSSAALASCLGSLLCGGWLPWFTEPFNHASWLLMRIMIAVSEGSAALPKAFWFVRAPSPAEFALYYALLGALLSGWLFRAGRWRWGVPVAAAAVFSWTAISFRDEEAVTVTVPPLGGAGIFTTAPGTGNGLLIDTGDERGAELVLKPFLRSQGINRIPQLLLTHGDLHHVGGFGAVTKDFAVGKLFGGPQRFRSAAYRQIEERHATGPLPLQTLQRGGQLGGWQVLHPAATDKFARADDASVVLLGEFYGLRVLLLSNLGEEGQRVLAEREPELRADVIIAGPPGRGEPLNDFLLELVRPRLILLATAEFPATARMSPALRERLEREETPLISTETTGAATLTIRPGVWELKTMSGILLQGNSQPAPTRRAHR